MLAVCFFQKCSRITKSLKICQRAEFDLLQNLSRNIWGPGKKTHFLFPYKKIICRTNDNVFEISNFEQLKVDRFGFVLKSESNGPPELHTTISKNREREKKWIKMLANWEKYSSSKKYYHMIRNRARKGIPDALRGRAWMFLR